MNTFDDVADMAIEVEGRRPVATVHLDVNRPSVEAAGHAAVAPLGTATGHDDVVRWLGLDAVSLWLQRTYKDIGDPPDRVPTQTTLRIGFGTDGRERFIDVYSRHHDPRMSLEEFRSHAKPYRWNVFVTVLDKRVFIWGAAGPPDANAPLVDQPATGVRMGLKPRPYMPRPTAEGWDDLLRRLHRLDP